jgi:hypothetical protein
MAIKERVLPHRMFFQTLYRSNHYGSINVSCSSSATACFCRDLQMCKFDCFALYISNSRQAPGDSCWPSTDVWNSFNQTLDGQLIATSLAARVCYPGLDFNKTQCDIVDSAWGNSSFQMYDPVGLDFPQWANNSCLPVNLTANASAVGTCDLGFYPRYTVNVTEVEHISAALKFAQENNIRVVVKTTGHDFLGRNTGYGSLNIWLKHYKKGITFSDSLAINNYSGSAVTINGGYSWIDVYVPAGKKGVDVVGGSNPVSHSSSVESC